MSKVFVCILIILFFILIFFAITSKIVRKHRAKKYGRISSNIIMERYYNKIKGVLDKSKFFTSINEKISYKLSIFNTLSFEKNRQLCLFGMLNYSILSLIVSVVLIIYFFPYWYIALLYILFINSAVFIFFLFFTDIIMDIYMKKMPETIKILQSRFVSKGNIVKAIRVSIPDLPKGIKAEMIRIYDALKMNEMYKAKDVFREIDKKYSDEHMSVLLDLIWLANYNGGEMTIKKQFEEMLNDVLEDIENQRDLRGAAMSYIFLAIFFIGAIPLVRIYNSSILSTEDMKYYSSREGMLFAAIYILFVFVVIGIMFYLKKKG